MLALEFIELNTFNGGSISSDIIQTADIVHIKPANNEECFVSLRGHGTIRVAHNKEWLIEQLEYNHYVARLKNN